MREREGRAGDSQPMPVINDSAYIHDLVKDDLEARKQLGARRYGTPLQAHNGRNALRDAYEEALDLAVYLKQALMEEEVPEVEVTDSRADAQIGHLLEPVEAPQMPVNRRRSGAKNISNPHLQSAFIDEARVVMGAPTLEDARALLGYTVTLSFNVDWHPATGVLTEIKEDSVLTPYLILDGYKERLYPLNSIQQIVKVR